MESTRDPERAAAVLAAGGLVAVPTETVYGLAADATNESAVQRVFEVKGRPAGHPLIVHVCGLSMLSSCVADVPEDARRLAEAFWPGPLTIVLHRSALIPEVVTGGLSTVGVRQPDHVLTLEVIRVLGRPIAAPSANRFGRVSPTSAQDVEESLAGDLDLVLDGGGCRIGIESTIVDLTGTTPALLRPGAVSPDEIGEVLGKAPVVDSGPPRAPGMLAAHYAPTARVLAVEQEEADDAVASLVGGDMRVAVMCETDVDAPETDIRLDAGPDETTYACRLYSLLREADRFGADVVVAVLPRPGGLGGAVRDRLRRAASTP